jgi:hypothetical protein
LIHVIASFSFFSIPKPLSKPHAEIIHRGRIASLGGSLHECSPGLCVGRAGHPAIEHSRGGEHRGRMLLLGSFPEPDQRRLVIARPASPVAA